RVTWAFDAQKTERKYAEKWKAFMSLHSFLKSNGIDYILLKGFTTAAFYPIPHHRDCGDIDIFSFQHDEIDELMMQKGIAFEESGCDEKHTLFFWEKVPVENHILISYEKRLKSREKVTDKYTNILATTKRKQYICGPKGEQVEVGAVPASILFPYNAYHIVGHYTWQTVTMRHLTDWYVMRKHVSEEGAEYPESVALYVGVMDELTEHYFDGATKPLGTLAQKYVQSVYSVQCVPEKVDLKFYFNLPKRWRHFKQRYQKYSSLAPEDRATVWDIVGDLWHRYVLQRKD
ncbi:MAG: nucleotidyltransferase family protein, partial [Bacteroidaceae bacterium]|nr:nucleotidyltransferase family protein [Bacteroidaceae bacterium]